MSKLPDLLRSHSEAICTALADRLRKAAEETLDVPAGGGASLLAALLALLEGGDTGKAAVWAEAQRSQSADGGLHYAKILATLSCFEHVLRFYVVKQAAHRKDILAELRQVAAAVDMLRRCCAEVDFDSRRADTPRSEEQNLQLAFRTLVEHGPDVVCLTTLQGKPVYLNKAGRRLLGLRDRGSPELPATTLHDYMTEESWAELRDVGVPAVKRAGHWEGQGQLQSPRSSNVIDVQTAAFLVRDPKNEKTAYLAVVHRPCGHELRLEEALEESDARKHAILESSLDPIITIDHRGVVTEFNRAAEQVFGRKRAEVLGTKPSEILFPPSKITGHQNRIDRYLNAGEGSLLSKRTEVIAVRSSGLPFEAELTMTINQERGMPVLTFFVRDISARKRAEEEQRRYAQDLERSNRELEQFAYVASHDLQEPLRKILTFGDRLEIQCGEALDDLGRQCLHRMKNAAERMQILINGLLTLSRVTTKATDFATVDLNKIIHEVMTDLEVKIEQNGATVKTGRMPTIQADPLQMRQLLQNLVGNALKFQKEDEAPVVEIRGKHLRPGDRLLGGDFADEDVCQIVVKDNGIGFDEKYLDRIFDVFQRLHPRGVHEGTGVGLAICRKIVDRHGGTITARTEPEHGATFIVELPVRQDK